jgi:hypothetical protein
MEIITTYLFYFYFYFKVMEGCGTNRGMWSLMNEFIGFMKAENHEILRRERI